MIAWRHGWRWPLTVLLVFLAAGHAMLWHVSTRQLEQSFAQWLDMQRQAGWTVEAGAPIRGGYPLSARLFVPEVRLQGLGAAIPPAIAWQAQQLTLGVAIWQPHKLIISASGAQSLRLGSGATLPFRADYVHLVLPLETGFPRWSLFSLAQFHAGMALAEGTASLTVRELQARVDLHPAAPQGEAAISIAIKAEGIRLPDRMPADGKPWALGPDIAALELAAHLDGPLPRLATLDSRLTQAASQWRDGGGLIKIERLHLRWGQLGMTSSATLALDAQLQPMGSATLRIAGHAAGLDALVAAGLLHANAAQMAKAVATMFATPTRDNDGEQQVELPLSLKNRRLLLRQFAVTRLPALSWPGQ